MRYKGYFASYGRLLGWLLPALLAASTAQAQQVLLQADVARDTVPARTGPNRRYFGHFYGSYALAAGASELGVNRGFASGELQLGGRLKRRLTAHLALNADLRYAYLRYALADDVVRPLPLGAPHDRETISYHQLQSEVSVRFNPGRRGNVVGRYLDLLTYGGPALAASHTTDDPARSGRLEVIEHEPQYLSRWLGGVGVRVGSNSVALVGRYRLSDALRPADATRLPEPPRWLLGLELGWF